MYVVAKATVVEPVVVKAPSSELPMMRLIEFVFIHRGPELLINK